MVNFKNRKRRGIAQAIFAATGLLIVAAFLWTVLTHILGYAQSWQAAFYPTAIDPTIAVFVGTAFTWAPVVVFFGALIYLIREAQRRKPDE